MVVSVCDTFSCILLLTGGGMPPAMPDFAVNRVNFSGKNFVLLGKIVTL